MTTPFDVPSSLSSDSLDGGLPATTDALQSVLTRHRRRQSRLLAGLLVPLLAAGVVGGFLVGQSGNKATTLSSASQPTTPHAPSTPPAASAPMIAASGGSGYASGVAVGGGSPTVPATQLLLRNALDGTRVRLYSEDFGATIKCPPNATCATPTPTPCFPTHIVTAEVSDDQTAGDAGAPEFNAPTGALDLINATVVGATQPQPILVAIAHTSSAVASVRLTTAYGTDKETPTSTGWVALALQLPATWTPATNSETPTGTLSATDATGKTLGTSDLSQMNMGKPCAPPPCLASPPPAGSNGGKTPPGGPMTGSVSSSGQVSSSGGQVTTGAGGGPFPQSGGGAVTCESTTRVANAPSTTA